MKRERMLWWCQECHASGVCDSETSVYDAIDRLRAAHDASDVAKVKGHSFSIDTVHVERIPSSLPKDGR